MKTIIVAIAGKYLDWLQNQLRHRWKEVSKQRVTSISQLTLTLISTVAVHNKGFSHVFPILSKMDYPKVNLRSILPFPSFSVPTNSERFHVAEAEAFPTKYRKMHLKRTFLTCSLFKLSFACYPFVQEKQAIFAVFIPVWRTPLISD